MAFDLTATNYGSALGRGLVPVGLRAHAVSPSQTNTTQLSATSRTFHPLTASDVGVVLPVWTQNIDEVNASYVTATIAASVECSDGTLVPFTFNGSLSASLRPGAVLVPDTPLAFGLQASPSGAPRPGVWIRTYISVVSPNIYPQNISAGLVTNEGSNGVAGTDQTLSGASTVFTTSGFIFGPAAVYGRTKTRKPIVALVGDSIISGSTDSNITYGFAERACAALGYPSVKLSKSGERGNAFSTPAGRKYRAAFLDGCTHAILEYGTNDLVNSQRTATQVQTDLLTIGTYLNNMGIQTWVCTVPPRTTSTDSWATTTNQTATGTNGSNTSNPTDLTTVNTYLRTVPSPFAGIFDLADLTMSARNSGLYVTGGATADGTHPSAALHATIAASLQTLMATWSVV